MAIGVSNFATTTLGAAISTTAQGAQTITLVSGSSFPSSGSFVIRVEDELILIDSRSGVTLTVNAASGRGFESTTSATHANGTSVYGVVTAYSLENYIQEQAVDAAVGGQATGTVGAITVANTHGASGTQTHHAAAHNLFSADHTGDVTYTDTPGDNELLQYDLAAGKWNAEAASAHGAHGGGSGSRGPYAALVYKSSSTQVTAIQPDGTVISGPSATDATVINAAIAYVDTLADGAGGTVFISAGVYDLASVLTGARNVRLAGEGIGSRATDGGAMTTAGTRLVANTNGMTVINIPSGAYGFVIQDIALDAGSTTGATVGINIIPGDCIVDHVYIVGFQTGIYVAGGDSSTSKAIRIQHSFIEGCSSYGVRVQQNGGTDSPTDGAIHECRILHMGTNGYGCYIGEGGWQLSDIHWSNSRANGSYDCYVASGASPFQVTNCYFDAHGTNALYLGGSNQATVSNNFLLWGPSAGTILYVAGTGICSIVGNRFQGGASSGTARWGIEFAQNPLSAGQVVVMGNHGKNFASNGGLIGFSGTVVPNGIVRTNPTSGDIHPYTYIDGNVRTVTG